MGGAGGTEEIENEGIRDGAEVRRRKWMKMMEQERKRRKRR